ncbi:STAS domain-containing protein [Geodermatophilus sp. SYSU D01176]
MAMTGDVGSSRAEDRGAGSEREPAAGSAAAEDSVFSESIDRRTGSIRARGRLDGRAADMLGGTVDALHRSGWGRIVLDLGGVQAVDGAGLRALRSLERRIAADGGHVALLNEPEPGAG